MHEGVRREAPSSCFQNEGKNNMNQINNTQCKGAAIYLNQILATQSLNSVALQLSTMREFAEQNGLRVVKVYQDEVESTAEELHGLQELLCDAAIKMFDVVLVFQLEAIATNKYDLVYYKRILKEYEVMLLSVTESPLEDLETKMLESILDGLWEHYQRNLANEELGLLVES